MVTKPQTNWKVMELAKSTGLTMRALHHYDRLGLVSPSLHTEARHRVYTQENIAKLQQVVSLKQLGFTLEEIKELVETMSFRPEEVLRIQLGRLREQIRIQEELHERLERLYELIRTRQHVTPEQLETLKRQGELLGPDKIREVENEWPIQPILIASIRAEMDKGTPLESDVAVRLAKRWRELTSLFTRGDPEIRKAAERAYQENPDAAMQMGVYKELYQYICKAAGRVDGHRRNEEQPSLVCGEKAVLHIVTAAVQQGQARRPDVFTTDPSVLYN